MTKENNNQANEPQEQLEKKSLVSFLTANVVGTVKSVSDTTKKIASTASNTTLEVVKTTTNKTVETGTAAITGISQLASTASNTTLEVVKTTTNKTVETGTAAITGISQLASTASNTTLEVVKTTANKTVETGTAAITGISQLASTASNTTLEASKAIVETLSQTGSAAITLAAKTIFTECSVPTFLLPTGTGCADFVCIFCFEEAIANLNNGVLVQPKIEVWAGRTDIDLENLIETIKEDFTSQFTLAREEIAVGHRTSSLELVDNLKEKQQEMKQELDQQEKDDIQKIIEIVVLVLSFSHPMLRLLLFSLAIFGSRKTIAKWLDYFRLSWQISGNEISLEREKKKLEGELDSKNAAFAEAIKNMKIKVHPLLQEVVVHFHRVENLPFVKVEVEEDIASLPPVKPLLQNPEYRAKVPRKYLTYV